MFYIFPRGEKKRTDPAGESLFDKNEMNAYQALPLVAKTLRNALTNELVDKSSLAPFSDEEDEEYEKPEEPPSQQQPPPNYQKPRQKYVQVGSSGRTTQRLN
jgi:hypothetical protein